CSSSSKASPVRSALERELRRAQGESASHTERIAACRLEGALDELVTDAAHGQQQLGAGGGALDGLAASPHVGGGVARVEFVTVSPHRGDDLFAAQDSVRQPHEETQHLELAQEQPHPALVQKDFVGIEVDAQAAFLVDLGLAEILRPLATGV